MPDNEEPRSAPALPPASMPELIPLNQGFTTRWLVSCAAAAAEDPDDPYAGWFEVDADGRQGTVDLWGNEMTPTEARNLAAALIEAARHAESYRSQLLSALSDQQAFVDVDLGPDATIEQKQAVNAWFRAAHARVSGNRPKQPQERAS